MHATIPAMPAGIHHILQQGIQQAEQNGSLAQGVLLAAGMAAVIKLGFGVLSLRGPGEEQRNRARLFFEDEFIIRDPNMPDGKRYYQGRILIRTKKAGDDMNVLIRFCPEPDELFKSTLAGPIFNPDAVVDTQVLNEVEAAAIEHDPDRCDLVIRFKDSKAILGLMQRPDAEVVQLLLENLVQITGNFGHMFKFGAIGNRARAMLSH